MSFLKDYAMLKRASDFSLAFIGIILSLPLWFFFGVLIWLEDGGSIFYSQDRVGKDGRIFKNIKFRSMIQNAEQGLGPVQAQKNDPRDSRIGRLMRKMAMDELPQLINILKGEMSFVGPRALRPIEKELAGSSYESRPIFEIPGFAKRASIRPGLTGVAQVFAGRSILREEKFRYDLWYVDHMNFWLDLKLIALSFLITFKAKWDI